jgi:uncharacterized damage-inducible protein DinB
MTERERLLDQFEREVQGQPWHGPSLTTILDGVTAPQAAHKVSPDAHSIWEILLHMTGWKREVTGRARGKVAAEPAAGDWPEIGEPTDTRWRDAQADHLRAQRELLDVLGSLSDAGLATRVPGDAAAFVGAGLSVRATLWGLVQHDVYHAGQIAILKKLTAKAR